VYVRVCVCACNRVSQVSGTGTNCALRHAAKRCSSCCSVVSPSVNAMLTHFPLGRLLNSCDGRWSEAGSHTYNTMVQQGLCAHNATGSAVAWGGWGLPTCGVNKAERDNTKRLRANDNDSGGDGGGGGGVGVPVGSNCLYDSSSPEGRAFLWDRLKAGYFDHGITNFWTDGTEPAGAPAGGLPDDVVFTSDVTGARDSWPAEAAFMCVQL
jgi:hypothetical protein